MTLCHTLQVKAETHTEALSSMFDPPEIRAEAPQTTGGFLTPCREKNFTNAEESFPHESKLQE